MRVWKWLSIILLAISLAVLVSFLHRNYRARSGSHPIAATGGRALSIRLPWGGEHYMQGDRRWADVSLGGTADTLGGAGCAVCSIAMAATSLGAKVTPPELNDRLIKCGGYTREGWIIWDAIRKALDDKAEAVVADRPSHADLDAALERGEYPIVKFILLSGITHWVVIVGKEGTDYLIHDPLAYGDKPIALSNRTSGIYSVRVIKRKA